MCCGVKTSPAMITMPPELSYYLALALANVNQPSEAREALSRISDPKFAQRVASLQRYVDSLE